MKHLFCPGCGKDMGERDDGVTASWCTIDCYNAHPELHPNAVHMVYYSTDDKRQDAPTG